MIEVVLRKRVGVVESKVGESQSVVIEFVNVLIHPQGVYEDEVIVRELIDLPSHWIYSWLLIDRLFRSGK